MLLALEARVSPALPEPQTAPALIFDSAASAVCRSCVRQQLCWQERADETYRLLCGCAGTILRQGQAREGDLPPAFCSACIRAEAFREAVNQALRTQQAELLAFRRSEESRQIACALLGHLARFVGAAGRQPKAQGAPRWRLSLGVRAVGLRGDTLCGDAGACFQVRTLQYVLLCDGMGTGAGAKADAEEAISLLRAMITAGFAAPEAMALLNELYLLRGDGCFSTIDLLELDLCTAGAVQGKTQPIALGLTAAVPELYCIPAALGSALGFQLFWGSAGWQGVTWSVCALALRIGLDTWYHGDQRAGHLAAGTACLVSAVGLIFQLWLGDNTTVGMYILRILIYAFFHM